MAPENKPFSARNFKLFLGGLQTQTHPALHFSAFQFL